MDISARAYLPDEEIVLLILGPKTTPEEAAKYGASVLALWKPRFAKATEHCWEFVSIGWWTRRLPLA